MTTDHRAYRLLACGSRHWRWPRTIHLALDHFLSQHGEDLVVIEGMASGADMAAHDWCIEQGLPARRHRCYPVDWERARRNRPDWRRAGNERNTQMAAELPHQVVAFHDSFETGRGGTSDMCLKALLLNIPVWIVRGQDLKNGWAPIQETFPIKRRERARYELSRAGLLSLTD